MNKGQAYGTYDEEKIRTGENVVNVITTPE